MSTTIKLAKRRTNVWWEINALKRIVAETKETTSANKCRTCRVLAAKFKAKRTI